MHSSSSSFPWPTNLIRSPLMVVVAINSYWIVLMFTYDHSYILIFASLFMEQA